MDCNNPIGLCITRGDSQWYTLNVTAGGEPQDLTGSTVFFTVKRSLADTDDEAVIHKSITTFDNAINGIATIKLTNSDTDLPLMRYFYDIQITLPGDFVKTVMKGSFDVVYQVTEAV